MKYINIANTDLKASNLVMGCMRLMSLEKEDVNKLVHTAMEEGVNFIDHADIYGGGQCESHFADSVEMNASLREKLIIQSKCGIRRGYFDFSREHIIGSVDASLKRLKTDYLDLLLLHRPDTLMDPQEVAQVFDELQQAGKVRYFGVSNQNPMQMELLKKYVKQPLVVNQLQLSMVHSPIIDSGITSNMNVDQGINREGSTLEYCRMNDVTIQAWSPFQKGFFGGVFLGDYENYKELNEMIDTLAEKYGVTNTAIAVAWITTHPANIQVILGTMNEQRVRAAAKGSDLKLTREEWYGLYKASGKMIP